MIPAISVTHAVAAGGVVSCCAMGAFYFSVDKATSLKNAVMRRMTYDEESPPREHEDEQNNLNPIPYMQITDVSDSKKFYEDICLSCPAEVRQFMMVNPIGSLMDLDDP